MKFKWKIGRGGRTYLPNTFTEHGVLMLSSVFNSEQAAQINIQIMRIFSKIRHMLADNAEIWGEIVDIKIALAKQIKDHLRSRKTSITVWVY